MRGAQTRTGFGAVELALDMTSEAITLYERAASGGWRKFAGAPLDDPEFQIIIGLVRSEAEKRCGGRRPVRLWLPSDQVLQRRTRISARESDKRLDEAYRHIEAQTVFRPEDVALAVSPDEPDGEATILITFAETWREARIYAERWGFLPGEVSTRHRAGAFGADGPVFRLRRTDQKARGKGRKLGFVAASAGLGAGAAAAAASIWILMPLVRSPEAPHPNAALEISSGAGETPASASTAPAKAPVPEQKPAPERSFASVPLTPPNPNAVSLEESLLALKSTQSAPSEATDSNRSLPEPVLNAVFRAIPNAAPFHSGALTATEAGAAVQGTSPTPVQMAPWDDLPAAPKMVAEALSPRLPYQPDPDIQEAKLPPVTAPAQPAIPFAPSADVTDVGKDIAIGLIGEAAERLAFRQPASMAADAPVLAAPPEAPFTEIAPPVVTIIPPGSKARLPVPMPLARPGPGDKSKVPVVAGPPAAPAPPGLPQAAVAATASAPPNPTALVQPEAMAPVLLALAGPPSAPFTEAAPPVVTIFPPGSTNLPVPMPPARPRPADNSKVPEVAGAPTALKAPGEPQPAEADTAVSATAFARQPSALAQDHPALAGPPMVQFAEAEPPVVTIIPPGSADLPVPMPPARPGPGDNLKVPQVAAAPATPPAPSTPIGADLGGTAAPAEPTIPRQPADIAPVQQALAGPPEAPVTDGPPPEVTIVPPGSTAKLPVPMPPSRPGPETSAPEGPDPTATASPGPNAPNPDQADSSPLDHEQQVQQLTASAMDLGDDLTGLALPPRRPASAAEARAGAISGDSVTPNQDDADGLAALTLPPPRPASIMAAVKPEPEPLAAATAPASPSQPGALTPEAQEPLPGAADALPPDPNAPTELAALSSPRPPTRPDRPLVPVKLPSTSLLPVIGGTSTAKVRAAATEQGLPMDQTALIGVLNLDGGRKALLRMPDGRYKSVVVGDLVDGWRVSAIGVDAMKFSKSGQDMTLQLVNR